MNTLQYDFRSNSAAFEASSTFMMEQTAALLAAYVSRNAVQPADLPQVIRQIHAALSALQRGVDQASAPYLPTSSAIAASIRHDRLVSFIDGKAYKS